jgi:Spy/CpxP family protein refolding chaperone
MKLARFAFSALLGASLSASVLAQPGPGMGPGGGMGPGMGPGGGGMGPGMGPGGRGMRFDFNKDNTPGWSLMTPEERAAHREKMLAAKTPEECKAIQEEHHKQMEARAKEKGQTLRGPRQNACDRMRSGGYYK